MPSEERSEEDKDTKNGKKDRKEGNGKNGRKISKDILERWKKLEEEGPSDKEERPKEEARPGLGLFKRKMQERKREGGPPISFLHPGFKPREKEEGKKVEEEEKSPIEETHGPRPGPEQGPEHVPAPKEGSVLDKILLEIKGSKDEFIKKRKEELKEEASRPKEDLSPHMDKLDILKKEMTKKREGGSKPDLFGVGFTPEVREARVDHMVLDEENMKASLKATMERTVREGSIVKNLDEVLRQPIDAVRDEYVAARSRIIKEIRNMDTKGFDIWIRRILRKLKKGRVFQAENDLVNLKIAIEAKRDREQLKKDREERLEARLASMEEGELGLDDVVSRHIDAIEIEMDQARARIDRDLRKMDTTGFEHVVRNIKEMVADDKMFEAEEQLLELKLALKARRHREELKSYRERRIIDKAHKAMPFIPVSDLEMDQSFEKEIADLLVVEEDRPRAKADLEEAKEVLEELVAEAEADEVMDELVPRDEMEEVIREVQCGVCGTILGTGETICPACGNDTTSVEEDIIAEIQCGVCGTLLHEGDTRCPACGTALRAEEGEDGIPVLEPVEEVGRGRPSIPSEPFEIQEIHCGVCGSAVPPGSNRCRACGTALFEPELELEPYPSLGPVEEEVYADLTEEEAFYPELAPMEEKVAYPELVPVEEEEGFPEVAPVDEVICPHCARMTPADTEVCDYCGLPMMEVPVLEPIEAEEYPELVPVGPGEDVTAEVSMEEEGVQVVDMMEEVEVTEEVEVIDLEAVPEEVPVEAVEAEAWAATEPLTESDVEWRRLVIRGKRLYEEGRVKESLEAYDEALEISPSFEAYFGKGSALLTLGWSNSALDCFNRAIELDARPEGYIERAKAQESLNRYGEAVESLDKAIEADPQNAEAWHIKGTMLMQMGQIKEAVQALDSWVALRPTEKAYMEAVTLTQRVLEEGIPEPTPADVAEELASVEEEELRVRRHRKLARSRGLTNGLALINGRGLVNGRSLTNGKRALINGRRTGLVNGRPLVNGKRGAVNGKGLINGRGLVNGASGLVNGRAISDGRGEAPVLRLRPARKRWVVPTAVVVMMVMGLVLGPFVYISMMQQEEGILIDGQFSDWQNTIFYDDTNADQANNRDVDIIQYGMQMDTKTVSFYIKVPSGNRMMNGAGLGVDVAHIFIETDGSHSTGYSIMGVGADHMIEVFGWEGKVDTARLFTFNSSARRSSEDWNGWIPGPSIKAMSKGTELEVQVERAELGAHVSKDMVCLVHMSDNGGNDDFSDHVISKAKGALGVDYDHINPTSVQPDSSDNPFLTMNLSAVKNDMEVTSLSLTRTGKVTHDLGIGTVGLWTDSSGNGQFDPTDTRIATGAFGAGQASSNQVILTPANPISIRQDTTIQLFATIDILDTVVLHQTIGLDVDRYDIEVLQGAVTVTKSRVFNSYIGSPSAKIVIDGAFDDWAGTRMTDSGVDIDIPRINIREYASHFDEDAVSFYLRTQGEVMSGMIIPTMAKDRPVPQPNQTNITPGPPVQPDLPVVTGADILVIYIDSDQDTATGSRELGIQLGIDHMIWIEGKSGNVISSTLFSFVGLGGQDGPWEEVNTIVPAANDRFRVETQVSRDALGLEPHDRVDAFFIMTDWEKNLDLSDSVLEGDRGQLAVAALDVIPDTLIPGAFDVPLVGIELQASEDVYLRALSFERLGNATDLATGPSTLLLDNGDRIYTPLDKVLELSTSAFTDGVVAFEIEPPLLVQTGTTTIVFLVTDVTFDGEDQNLGVSLPRLGVDSTARTVTGQLPLSTFVSTISSDSDRGYNNTVDYSDGTINWYWNQAKEAQIKDSKDKIDENADLREARVSDNGTWLNFYVKTQKDLDTIVHVYIDVDGDGTADFDLVYDNDNTTVRLFEYDGSTWSEVDIGDDDRYDLAWRELEFGIEYSYLNITTNQTINYYVTTSDDPEPDGTAIDRGPDSGWSEDYTTIPEFQDLMIPVAGAIIIFTIIRRKRLRLSRHRQGKDRGNRGPRRMIA